MPEVLMKRKFWVIIYHFYHLSHYDLMTRKGHFLHYWPFVRGIHWLLVDSPYRGPVMGKFMYAICSTHVSWFRKSKAYTSGHISIKKTVFPDMGIPMLKIRQSRDHFIFNMGIPMLVRWHFYTETAPLDTREEHFCTLGVNWKFLKGWLSYKFLWNVSAFGIKFQLTAFLKFDTISPSCHIPTACHQVCCKDSGEVCEWILSLVLEIYLSNSMWNGQYGRFSI